MKRSVLFVGMIAALTFASCGDHSSDPKKAADAQNEDKKGVNEDDSKFVTEAASGGMMEVQAGQLAATNAMDPQVKGFGQQMVTDHTKANDELKALAMQKNITLPAAPDNDHQKKMDDLAKKKGADFDKAYIDWMVDDHKEDVDHFKKAGDDAKDADIKAWAAGKVPTLQHHLDMAKGIQDNLKKNK